MRVPASAAACLAAFLLACAPASAAGVLLGPSDLSASDPFAECGIGCTSKVFVPTAVPGGEVSAPADGTITSWRVKGAPPKKLRLRVLRPLADGRYQAMETSGIASESSGTGSTVAMVAIGVGEQIGIELQTSFPGASPFTLLGDANVPGGAWVGFEAGIADGQSAMPTTSGLGSMPLVNATVELHEPVIDLLGADQGPAVKGEEVLIAGRHLALARSVKFGDLPAQVLEADNNHIVAIAPPQGSGTVEVTVTTAGGTSKATAATRYTYRTSAQQRRGAPALRLWALKLSPRAFPAGAGAKVSFRSSRAARVRFGVQRRARGGWAPLRGSFARGAREGVNSFRFGGRLRGKKLSPGRYRLLARAQSAEGKRSKQLHRPFRVLPPGGAHR